MGRREIAERVLELLAGVDPEQPRVDEGLARDRLCAYVEALGLARPKVRFFPDVRALRVARVYPADDRSRWHAFLGRQGWLLSRSTSGVWRWTRGGLRWSGPDPDEVTPGLERLVRSDRTVLAVGLGRSRDVAGVRQVTVSLELAARALLAGGAQAPPKRVGALVPLAEAAAAGAFAVTVGRCGEGDLVALLRPRMRFDGEGRLHHWDGLPAAEWPNGKGLYFWHGVEMTESAGRAPDAVTPARVAGWANAERRRVAIERIGVGRFMQALGAEVIQEDDYGRLWRTTVEVDGEPLVAVEVVNSTPEPDGTSRRYFLRVPPHIRTSRRAVAWSFGLTRKTYAPVAES
ncbi:MAG TPA: hypothetical protein VNJ53_13265 [Gaiellaceae bacterium]|nr:hypothetical protein [Gaiellaceae bacterium]